MLKKNYLLIFFCIHLHIPLNAEEVIPIVALEFDNYLQKSDLSHVLNYKDIRLIKTNKNNYGLQVEKNESLLLDLNEVLNSKSGAISFWVMPQWEEKGSHTFISMLWDGLDDSYMVVSYGWWEPAGNKRLYFVLSNQDKLHCSLPYKLQNNIWTMLTVSWSTGEEGSCTIYVNDRLLVNKAIKNHSNRLPKSSLHLGSDKGTGIPNGRSKKAYFDNVFIYNSELHHSDVLSLYIRGVGQLEVDENKKYAWMDEYINKPYMPERNDHGEILESRIIFDEDIRWALSEKNTDIILKRIKSAGFNVYVPCVWHGKGLYFPSKFAHLDKRVVSRISSGSDPLEYLIKKAHSMGIEVHPWFTVVKREDSKYPEFYDSGTPDGAYNVHNEKFRTFMSEIMLDMVKRYDVDGINLDYIRTMGICTSKFCRNNYKKFTGQNLMTDYLGRAVLSESRNRIQKWQDHAVVGIVKNLSISAKSIKPELIISVDAHPKPNNVIRPLQGRNVIEWANNDWIDVIFNMDYSQNIDIENHEAVRQELINKDKLVFLLGNYDKIQGDIVSRDPYLVAKNALYNQRRWPGIGIAYYIYNLLSDEQINKLSTMPFNESSVPNWH